MFDERISDTQAVLYEIQDEAVQRARTPGAQTYGNAGGTTGTISNLEIAPPDIDGEDEIGVDEDGVFYFPFIVGVDYVGDPGAYIPAPRCKFDFGR